MNIFIAIMLVFAAAGLLDEILGGKLGLMPNFEKGLATMGGLAMSTVGFYAIGVTYVQTHAEAIAEAAKHMPFDPALIPSRLLAPDMGGAWHGTEAGGDTGAGGIYRCDGSRQSGNDGRISAAGLSGSCSKR